MIPVLIVLGSAAASAAGLFVGAAATAAAHEVVQESKDELNAINADMQKMKILLLIRPKLEQLQPQQVFSNFQQKPWLSKRLIN